MSKTYRIHGARYLRKYSAAEKSSCYSYMADVRKIANTLCTVPWERVSGDIPATTTIHTEEGLDWNEPERDRFDAAEWCGEHSDGYHRAFAQAACYVFKLPDSAVGKSIEGLRVNVTSDPYNPYGARIAAMTSATLDIPMDCDTVRQGEMFRGPDEDGLGAAPRIFVKDTKTGKETWYSNNEIVELTPGETLTAKRYLFVFVCLENYNRGRDGWIEGSSYIDNDVEITLSAAASDFDEDEINDCSAVVEPVEYPVVVDGVLPDMNGSVCGVVAVNLMADGTKPTVDDGGNVINIKQVSDCMEPDNLRVGVSSLYGRLNIGDVDVGLFGLVTPDRKRIGAGFSVRSSNDIAYNGLDGFEASPRTLALTASSLLVPFSIPDGSNVAAIVFDWSDWLTGRTPSVGSRFNFWIKKGSFVTDYPSDTFKKSVVYSASERTVDGWELLKTVEAGIGTTGVVPVDFSGVSVATVMVTAYVPQSIIADVLQDFCIGTGDFHYNSTTKEVALSWDQEIAQQSAFVPGKSYYRNDIAVALNPTLVSSNVGSGLYFIRYGAGKFVAASGYSGGLKYSEDGLTWTSVMSGSFESLYYLNGLFIAGGSSTDCFWTSRDGVNWTKVSADRGYYRAAAYGGGKWIVCGEMGGSVYRSGDGVNWTKCDVSGEHTAIAYGDGKFVAFVKSEMDFYADVSTNGIDWQRSSLVSYYKIDSVTYGDDLFVATGDNSGVYYSEDGMSWSAGSKNGFSYMGGECVMYRDGLWVCSSGLNASNVCWSEDGMSWNQSNIVDVRSLTSLCYLQGVWIVAGRNGVYVSGDGKVWSKISGNFVSSSDLSVDVRSDDGVAVVGLAGIKAFNVPFLKHSYVSRSGTAGDLMDYSSWWLKDKIDMSEISVKCRMVGRSNLMVPDITLIG